MTTHERLWFAHKRCQADGTLGGGSDAIFGEGGNDALDSDRTFRVPAIRLAEAQAPHQPRTYKYFFTWSSPARRGTLGACHALELPFVFGTLDAPTMDRFAGKGPDAEALATRMMDAWIAFAKSGAWANPLFNPWTRDFRAPWRRL